MDRRSPDDLRAFVRDIPDFPRPGILFRDITPLLGDPGALRTSIDLMLDAAAAFRPDAIAAVESRGFLFGAPVAARLGVGLVPVRKPGKLPYRTRSMRYDLEYGSDSIEMHEDALAPGSRVVLMDDLLATGGTAAAAIRLIREAGAEVVGAAFLIELAALGGAALLGVPARSVLRYV